MNTTERIEIDIIREEVRIFTQIQEDIGDKLEALIYFKKSIKDPKRLFNFEAMKFITEYDESNLLLHSLSENLEIAIESHLNKLKLLLLQEQKTLCQKAREEIELNKSKLAS